MPHRFHLTILAGLLGLLASASAADDADFKPLFNGKNLDGWVPVLRGKDANPDKTLDPKKTWKVEEETIICSGTPNGYIRTDKMYENYVLKLEWRYARPATLQNDADFKGNSGVLVHIQGEDRVWPKSIEVQLHNPTAGSIFPVSPNVTGAKTDNRVSVMGKAKPVGQWNTYEVVCKDGTVEAILNGTSVGKATGCDPRKGYLCLQSEGAEIHFRNVRIKELK
jgi:hypothetical protein